jgi:hypothetical protein
MELNISMHASPGHLYGDFEVPRARREPCSCTGVLNGLLASEQRSGDGLLN